MENTESVFVQKGTHPFLTVLFFGTIIAGVITSGSYFSKQRSMARDLEEGLKSPISAFATAAVTR